MTGRPSDQRESIHFEAVRAGHLDLAAGHPAGRPQRGYEALRELMPPAISASSLEAPGWTPSQENLAGAYRAFPRTRVLVAGSCHRDRCFGGRAHGRGVDSWEAPSDVSGLHLPRQPLTGTRDGFGITGSRRARVSWSHGWFGRSRSRRRRTASKWMLSRWSRPPVLAKSAQRAPRSRSAVFVHRRHLDVQRRVGRVMTSSATASPTTSMCLIDSARGARHGIQPCHHLRWTLPEASRRGTSPLKVAVPHNRAGRRHCNALRKGSHLHALWR